MSQPKQKQKHKQKGEKKKGKHQKDKRKVEVEKSKGPPETVEDFLKTTKKSWETMTTFHQLYVRHDKRRVLFLHFFEIQHSSHTGLITLRGFEGSLPDMWDITPKNTGLRFEHAPDKFTLLLVEEQQSQLYNDLAASIYSEKTRGMNRGFLRSFKPIFVSEKQKTSLVDVTGWLFSFSSYALKASRMSRRGLSMGPHETFIQAVRAFPDNFFAAFATQRRSPEPLKGPGKRTVFYTVGFCRLPEFPMTPRMADRRVGFFTTALTIGGTKSVGIKQSVINRWDLRRRNNEIVYLIDPKVPKVFWATIRKAVRSWNAAFAAAGFKNEPIKCYAPCDREFPEEYAPGDARWSCIFMTDPYIPVYGYGPSMTDFRSGEILVGHVLLGFQSFVTGTSKDSLEALKKDFHRPYLDADHPDVLANLEFTVMHEIGHTLGLRHNFISTEDGRSSVMDYPDDIDTTTEPEIGKFGGHYPKAPGRYDVYAIKYGYTPLLGEKRGVRHPKLDLLANGQEHYEKLSIQPLNPLFATDENVFSFDPRINRWVNQAELMGRDKIKYLMALRAKIRKLAVERPTQFRPEELTVRVVRGIRSVFRSVAVGCRFIGGAFLDETRTKLMPCSPDLARTAVRSLVDLCVGDALRLSPEEYQFFATSWSMYDLRQVDSLQIHSQMVEGIILLLLSQLQAVENQRATASNDTKSMSTYEVLVALCFEPGNDAPAVFHPLSFHYTPDAKEMSSICNDLHRTAVQHIVVRLVRNISSAFQIPSAVSLGAKAVLTKIRALVKTALAPNKSELHPVALAHWKTIAGMCKVKIDDAGARWKEDHAQLHATLQLPTLDLRGKINQMLPFWLNRHEQW